MAKLILTNCNQLVPVNRVCWGSWGNVKVNPEICQDCSIYAEKKKSQVCTPKAYPFGEKMPIIRHNGKVKIVRHAFALTVEAVM